MTRQLLLSSIFLMAVSASAQQFGGGIQAGLTATQVAGDVSSGYNKAGLYAGGWVSLAFTKHSVMLMELDYIQKGSRENPTDENGYISYRLNLHYAELPVLYKYIINEKFAAEAGLAYSFFITAKEEYNFESEVSTKPFNRHNLSLIAGLYYNFTGRLRVNVRSSSSITPIRPHISGAKRFFNRGQYNDVLSIGLQYDLRLWR